MKFEEENGKKIEGQENKEIPVVQESPEKLQQKMAEQSQEEVADFQAEGEKGIEDIEKTLEGGLVIDEGDKAELKELDQEAEGAKEELKKEIGAEEKQAGDADREIDSKAVLRKGMELVHEMHKAGQEGTAEYKSLSEMLVADGKWKSVDQIDIAKLQEIIDGKNKTVEAVEKSTGSKEAVAVENEEQKLDPKKVLKKGMEMVHELYGKGETQSDKYQTLSEILIADGKWKSLDQVDIAKLQEIMNGENEKVDVTKLHEEIKGQPVFENRSAMKERTIEKPELLSEKEASKKFLAEERTKLAQEILAERKAQRERLSKLKNIIDVAQEKIEGESGDKQFGRISELQSAEANTMKDRLESPSDLNEQDAKDEQENISQLITNSENVKSLKTKLEEHYAKADAISKEHFDTLNRSLEHVMKRNNAFIVHVITESEETRHNANSNVSSEATYEDDIDIMLALEPAVSASSIVSGKRASLWPGQTGFLLGGGQIGEAGHSDLGSHGDKIKKRGGENASIEKIDEVVGREKGEHSGMNEVVVNNAEISGFFQKAGKDENGKIWMYSLDTKKNSKRTNQTNLARYKERFALASEKGIPLYIMTEDMNVYEYLGVNDDGSIEIGKQLTPEEVANGKAGLPPEKRREIGEKLLEKKIFKKQETQEEAREILDELTV